MLNENHVISKSKNLIALSEINLSIQEYKILDIYLSKIDPTSLKKIEEETLRKLENKTSKEETKKILIEKEKSIMEATTVSFSKEEYCRLMNITSNKIRNSQLKSYTEHLLQNIITVNNGEEAFKQFPLFLEASLNENIFTIQCNYTAQEVKQLFFDLGNYKYIKYRLKNTIHLNSIYAIKLYIYLKDNIFRSNWNIDLDKLRNEILECNSKYYQEFKWFKKDILQKIKTEINEKTDISFEYETVKKGRTISAINFICEDKTVINIEANEIEIGSDYEENKNNNYEYFKNSIRESGIFINLDNIYDIATLNYIKEIDYKKVHHLYNLCIEIPSIQLLIEQQRQWNINDDEAISNINEEVVGNYLYKKIVEMKTRDVKNKFAYLKVMINKDYEKEIM